MLNIKITRYQNAMREIQRLRERAETSSGKINLEVSRIVENIRKNGDAALRDYTEKFDKVKLESFELSREEVESAYSRAEPSLVSALEKAAQRIMDFHKNQIQKSWLKTDDDGTIMGQTVRGLERVGVYIPGGTAAYPSSVLMNIIPAKIAGVGEIILATPPFRTENGKNAILAAAKIAGADRVFTIGGAQAVAALAFGTESVPKVDKITGPGNAYVAAAKTLCYGKIDIDMIAGPSEILIIADDTGNADYIAADMLSQAEHDKLASAVLVTTSQKIADMTVCELEKQVSLLERRDIAQESLNSFALIVVCDNLREALDVANEIAPEHLEVMTENPITLLPLIKNAGSIFLGELSPEPLGDYMAGPNHVLPTGGTARFSSPLSVESFVKKSSFIMASRELFDSISEDIITIANHEGLTAHAKSVEKRTKGLKSE